MKKIFTFVLLLFACMTAKAQMADTAPVPLKALATEQTRELAQKIGLNELEYIKIRNYTLQKMKAIQEINQQYAQDDDMRSKKIAAIEEEYQKNLVATLSPKQHLNYVSLHNRQ
jgi:hypothetical protein